MLHPSERYSKKFNKPYATPPTDVLLGKVLNGELTYIDSTYNKKKKNMETVIEVQMQPG